LTLKSASHVRDGTTASQQEGSKNWITSGAPIALVISQPEIKVISL
jgi:hypothetical protein